MPGPKRKAYRRKNTRRRKNVPGWGGVAGRLAGLGMKHVSKGGMAYKALRLARKVANAVNVEYKINDLTGNAQSVDYNGYLLSLLSAQPAVGTAYNQRIGDSIKLQNLQLRYFGSRNGVDAIMRILVIFDPMSKISTVADVLQDYASGTAVISPKNYEKRFQNRILYDRTITLTTADHPYVMEDITIPIDQHVQFNNGTQTVNTGNLWILAISNIVTTNVPTLSWKTHLTYTDD